MKYLQTYNQHNEGIKSGLATAGLIGSLLTNPMTSSAEEVDKTEISQTNNKEEAISQIQEISDIRKEKSSDPELSKILDDIKYNIQSDDAEKLIELYNKLTTHLEDKYAYKVEKREIITEADMISSIKNMTAFEIMGWLGSILLAICGAPQAIKSYKEKHSDGLSWSFILLWAFGELFALAYVYDKLDLPLLLNYGSNILILGIILYYKINSKNNIKL